MVGEDPPAGLWWVFARPRHHTTFSATVHTRHNSETLLISRIRAGEPDAWNEIIARYEGRLLGFRCPAGGQSGRGPGPGPGDFCRFPQQLAELRHGSIAGGLSVSIAAHKLTDFLRREGRRPTMPLLSEESSEAATGQGTRYSGVAATAPAATPAATSGTAWKKPRWSRPLAS